MTRKKYTERTVEPYTAVAKNTVESLHVHTHTCHAHVHTRTNVRSALPAASYTRAHAAQRRPHLIQRVLTID